MRDDVSGQSLLWYMEIWTFKKNGAFLRSRQNLVPGTIVLVSFANRVLLDSLVLLRKSNPFESQA